EIAEDVERIGDDLMRLLALDVGDEADAAGVLLQRKIVEAFGRRAPIMLARRMLGRFRRHSRRQRICHDVSALEFRPAHVPSSQSGKGPHVVFGSPCAFGAPWAFRGTDRATALLKASRIFRIQASVPGDGPACTFSALNAPAFRCNPCAEIASKIETVILS